MKIMLKKYILELFDPVFTFYTMIKKQILVFVGFFSALLGVVCFAVGVFIQPNIETSMIEFTRDMLGDYITILALFVSFTMGCLTIILTSNSQNISDLKETDSKEFKGSNGEFYSLYQILATQITHAVIIEIIFLILCIFEKCIINYLSAILLKVLCSLNIALFVYVLIVLLIIIKNVYFSFWKSK